MASIITIKCLETIIRNKNVLNIYIIKFFFIKYILYKNAHDRTIFTFLNVIIFSKIRYVNLWRRANFAGSLLPPAKIISVGAVTCS